ncbi:MAG: DegT/DnrJ/EryC1/StrS family aminotransferase [Magnetococcales bacterium]|nr:DegT/DnrJ/EryC1/StrS family aminotransferase [Magnetococcales bacterium]
MSSLPLPVTIPLYRPDLTHADGQACLRQVTRAPFVDGLAARAWEAGWERLWERRAVAFARHDEALGALKGLFGWHSGDMVETDPLLDPAWSEALAANWLHAAWRDIDPMTGVAIGAPLTRPEGRGITRAMVVHHPFGLPAPCPDSDAGAQHGTETRRGDASRPDPAPVILEEISSIPRPLPGIGHGLVQMVNLEGPRILPVGVGCLLLSTDASLIEALIKKRSRPPSGPASALGSALLAALPSRLERRAELAERYLGLRLRGLGILSARNADGRGWEIFQLLLGNENARADLQTFLRRAGIGCAAPLWFTPSLTTGAATWGDATTGGDLPGLRAMQTRALAIPLYAALSDPEQKKIINRIHRWAERR